MILIGKLLTLAFWALVAGGLADALGEYSTAMVYAGAVILVAHAIEATLMHTVWKQKAAAGLVDTVLVLIFGFFHLKPLIDRERANAGL